MHWENASSCQTREQKRFAETVKMRRELVPTAALAFLYGDVCGGQRYKENSDQSHVQGLSVSTDQRLLHSCL